MTLSWKLDPSAGLHVLLPFDFSDASRAAITPAQRFAGPGGTLTVLHVVPHIDAASPGFLAGEINPKLLRERAEDELDKALSEFGAGGATKRVRMGDPAAVILDAAAEIGAELIVIPSQGKSGLRRWMIGSVAERVVRRATCPVLVLPIEPEDVQ